MTNRGRRYLIASARQTCLAAILFSLLATTAWGQQKSDLEISTLTRDLKQRDSFVRWRAARALLKVGSYSRAAVPALIEALNIEDGDISDRARDALVTIGPDAVPDLIEALTHRDSLTHSKAIEALVAIGPPAVPSLIEALKDDDHYVRGTAIEALSQINPKPQSAIPALVELLNDVNRSVRLSAIEVLLQINPTPQSAIPALINALNDGDRSVRLSAIEALKQIDPKPKAAVPILTEMLKDRDLSVRVGAARTLLWMGEEGAPAYPVLIEALPKEKPYDTCWEAQDFARGVLSVPGRSTLNAALASLTAALGNQDKTIRIGAACVLREMGAGAKPALAALIGASRDPDAQVRSNVARALGTIDPTADAVVAALLELLKDPDKGVRSASASALKPAPARAAIYPLILALRDSDASVRRDAANSLARRDGRFAVPRLIERLGDQDREVRDAAINALKAIGPGAAQALVEALKHQDANTRSAAALILGELGPNPASAAALIAALKDQDASVRRSAVSSIGSLTVGPEQETAIPALIEALESPDQGVRSRAALVLAVRGWSPAYRYQNKVPIPLESVVPVLIDALKDQDPAVRSKAAAALRDIGTDAKVAAPFLVALLFDRDSRVGLAAANAFRAVGGDPALVPAAEWRDLVIPRLIGLLRHPERETRESAISALSFFSDAAVPVLLKLLSGEDSLLRVRSYYALVGISNVPGLIASLKSRDEDLRRLVLDAIEEIRVHSMGTLQANDMFFDPSRKYVFQRVRTGCGSEGDGRTVFVSELDSGKSFPILATCAYLSADKFLQYAGRYYLLVVADNGEDDCQPGSFWLYDVKANEFVIHAEGGVEETAPGVFSYAYCSDENGRNTPVGTVTMNNLINRESPLRLLPRPMHGLTLRKNTKVFHTFSECFQDDTNPRETTIIRNAGTRVLIITKCEDGSYEIYHKGRRGRVPKGSLKLTK